MIASLLVVTSVMTTGWTAVLTIIAVGLLNSVMFPTIFTLAIDGLGRHTEQGSGILCAAIVGGALIPVAAGHASRTSAGLHISFLLPAVCYLYIAWYGLKGHATDAKPAATPAVAAHSRRRELRTGAARYQRPCRIRHRAADVALARTDHGSCVDAGSERAAERRREDSRWAARGARSAGRWRRLAIASASGRAASSSDRVAAARTGPRVRRCRSPYVVADVWPLRRRRCCSRLRKWAFAAAVFLLSLRRVLDPRPAARAVFAVEEMRGKHDAFCASNGVALPVARRPDRGIAGVPNYVGFSQAARRSGRTSSIPGGPLPQGHRDASPSSTTSMVLDRWQQDVIGRVHRRRRAPRATPTRSRPRRRALAATARADRYRR